MKEVHHSSGLNHPKKVCFLVIYAILNGPIRLV